MLQSLFRDRNNLILMEKIYNPNTIEQHWYTTWESENFFEPQGQGKSFCIMLPPPNVTGRLHMGHGFQHTLMDVLVRYHRMQGDNTLWQPGTDHAGISTQMVVERQLEAQGKNRRELGREAFVGRVWEWKNTSGHIISQQMRRLGSSTDWSRERFTMDDSLSQTVQNVFIQLYNEGLIYRGKRLVNWDPKLQTAISDLEVIACEEQGYLWFIRYPLVNSSQSITIATTRPETLLGDVAVAVHPEDSRYHALVGQLIQLPLTDRTIPIIADAHVDPEFGTGCVKVTPAHDFNDYAISKRHQLDPINIFTPQATLNDNVPDCYRGLEREPARAQILADLTTHDLLVDSQAHQLNVPRGEKSHAIIEPYLTDQWFVHTAPLAKAAIQAVENGQIRFVPDNWKNTYFQWMHNLEDWCISRQLWWGHRIPAWYDPDGTIYVGLTESKVRQAHKISKDIPLRQDDDVLDTWFSSALWPFSTLGWPQKTPEFEQFYPSNVLITGFDIIFFWIARMIMMGLKFTGQIPFHEVYVTGLIRDAEGKKMSKSKGNVLDPIDIIDGIALPDLIQKRTQHLMLASTKSSIEELTQREFPQGIPAFGADALRYTYCALANTGRDIRFDLERVGGYRNFCNKLWNASRYILSQNHSHDLGDGPIQHNVVDRWIRSRLQHVIAKAHHYLATYRFDLLANKLYDFVWHEYCDWYLEFSKSILYSEQTTSARKRGTYHTLVQILESILCLLHPIIPFITEEIWQKIAPLAGKQGKTIMLQAYPIVDEAAIDVTVEREISWLQAVIVGIRQIRSEMNIAPKQELTIVLRHGDKLDKERSGKYHNYLVKQAKLSQITWLDAQEKPPAAAIALVDSLEILIPLAGIINTDAETQRLNKEIAKHQQCIQKAQTKLANENFTQRAPAEVLAKEQNRLVESQTALDKLQSQLEHLQDV